MTNQSTVNFLWPRCQHIKVNGVQCGSPALKTGKFCYYHQGVRNATRARRSSRQQPLMLPLLEDPTSVQVAIQQIIHALAAGQLQRQDAALMLYGLQTAASNLRHMHNTSALDVITDPHNPDHSRVPFEHLASNAKLASAIPHLLRAVQESLNAAPEPLPPQSVGEAIAGCPTQRGFR